MPQKQNIIPWECHVCGREFDTLGGGICKECGKATCNLCLGSAILNSLKELKMPKANTYQVCADKIKTT